MEHATKLKWLNAGVRISALLMLSPFIGLAGTVWGMVHSFEKFTSNGQPDPALLGAAVGENLMATVAGIAVAIPAFGLFLACYIPYRRLKKVRTTPPPALPVTPAP